MATLCWFEQYPELSQAIGTLLKFPDEMQTIIADGVCVMAERDYHANEMVKNFRSLGTERILAFYRFRDENNKQFSANPSVHKAMNYLLILSDRHRRVLALHMIGMTSNFVKYLYHCKSLPHNPSMEEFTIITEVYVVRSPESIEKVIDELIEKKMVITSFASFTTQEEITDQREGMRVKGEVLT